jgi:hypothetical protein
MDKLQHAVLRGIAGTRKEPLEDNEKTYIINRLKQVNLNQFKNQTSMKIVLILVDMLTKELAKLPKKMTEAAIDIHDVMVQEIGNAPETYSFKKIDKNATVDKLLQTPNTIQRIFNPFALRRKAYLLLDRKYQIDDANNINEFKWQISDTGRSYSSVGTSLSCVPIKDIVKIKMFPFRFPSSDRVITDFHNLSVEIKELSTHACIMPQNKRYHFMFDIERTGSNTYDPYKAVDPGNSIVEFEFFDPIIELDEVTIAFGNPEYTINLDPDTLYGTFASVGAQTEITFTQPHKCSAGCIINVYGFNTVTPFADKNAIDLINSEQGVYVVSVTSNTMILDIDISSIGAIVGSPFNIYFNAKRFALRLELTYLCDS